MIDRTTLRRVAQQLAALAEPIRLQVVDTLARGPRTVSELSELIGVVMPNMSHHLGMLRAAGLVESERAGRTLIYSLRPDVFAAGDGVGSLGTLTLGGFRVVIRGEVSA